MGETFRYNKWQDADIAVRRAIRVMDNTGVDAGQHVITEVRHYDDPTAFGGVRKYKDYRLSRFAAYLVAMNDPHKPEVAAAQAYFAIKTREAELMRQHRARAYADALRVAEGRRKDVSLLSPKFSPRGPGRGRMTTSRRRSWRRWRPRGRGRECSAPDNHDVRGPAAALTLDDVPGWGLFAFPENTEGSRE
ncbi:hypothetical protein [Streptomyces sp. 6N223]|uniref:hypothetical protein n=1 Tax=Streptomyces sp. 6N223 TaxID=3457412 RepID=UPI003FD1D1F9